MRVFFFVQFLARVAGLNDSLFQEKSGEGRGGGGGGGGVVDVVVVVVVQNG